MPNDQERPEDQLERMLAEHAAGIPSPQHPEFDRLVSAGERLRDAQRSAPPPADRNRAFSRMMNEVESERMRSKSGRFSGFLSGITSRPVAGTAMSAVLGLVVVSALGFGVATATGNGEPVRELLRISHSSSDLEFRGTVTAIGASDITVDGGGVLHVLTTNATTRIKEHGDTVDASSLFVGASVEIHAQTQSDGSVLAVTIGIEDDVVGSPTGSAGNPASGTPAAGPTVDDHGGDRPRDDRTPDDNSGPGSGDDDRNSDDNSGSGSGSDDRTPDDNSGPGSGDDRTSDDNSGSGSGSDDRTSDDDSGSGSGSGSDDNSGSGSGGGSDDNSGSGHGSDDSGSDDNSHGGGN